MKKVFKSSIVVAAITVSCYVAWNAFDVYLISSSPPLLLENVEALSYTSEEEAVQNDYIICDDGTNSYTLTRIQTAQSAQVYHIPFSDPEQDELTINTTFTCVSSKGPNQTRKGARFETTVSETGKVDCSCPLKKEFIEE